MGMIDVVLQAKQARQAAPALALLGRALPEFLKDQQGFGPWGAQIVIRDEG